MAHLQIQGHDFGRLKQEMDAVRRRRVKADRKYLSQFMPITRLPAVFVGCISAIVLLMWCFFHVSFRTRLSF